MCIIGGQDTLWTEEEVGRCCWTKPMDHITVVCRVWWIQLLRRNIIEIRLWFPTSIRILQNMLPAPYSLRPLPVQYLPWCRDGHRGFTSSYCNSEAVTWNNVYISKRIENMWMCGVTFIHKQSDWLSLIKDKLRKNHVKFYVHIGLSRHTT